jgi:hypothetical protein
MAIRIYRVVPDPVIKLGVWTGFGQSEGVQDIYKILTCKRLDFWLPQGRAGLFYKLSSFPQMNYFSEWFAIELSFDMYVVL